MTKYIKKIMVVVMVLVTLVGCNKGNIKETARYIKHSEVIGNFETYKGEPIKVEGVALIDGEYKDGDDIFLVNKKDEAYEVYIIPNNVNYKPYNGEYVVAYGKLSAISKEPVFFDVKAARIDTELIEQAEPPAEIKEDVLIQEFIKQ